MSQNEKNTKKQSKEKRKLSKQNIFTIIVITAFIVSILYSNLGEKKVKKSDTITFSDESNYTELEYPVYDTSDAEMAENLDDFYYDYLYEGYEDMDADEGYSYTDDSPDVTTEEVNEVSSEESTETGITQEPSSSNGFYDEVNKTIEDMAILSDSNVSTVIQGLVLGYISDCQFITNQFKEKYTSSFVEGVESVEVISVDLNGGTSTVKINNDKEYNVTFTVVDFLIDTMSVEEVK